MRSANCRRTVAEQRQGRDNIVIADHNMKAFRSPVMKPLIRWDSSVSAIRKGSLNPPHGDAAPLFCLLKPS